MNPSEEATPLEKVVSGGQTGVDRAGLDAARERGFLCGGWCPRGRRAEDGTIPATYLLEETPSREYPQRTEWNVRDSHGTLILTRGKPSGGTRLTVRLASKLNRPCLIVDLETSQPENLLKEWLKSHSVRVLNIAGPRSSSKEDIYAEAMDWLRTQLPAEP